jgi:hypothetical protein
MVGKLIRPWLFFQHFFAQRLLLLPSPTTHLATIFSFAALVLRSTCLQRQRSSFLSELSRVPSDP